MTIIYHQGSITLVRSNSLAVPTHIYVEIRICEGGMMSVIPYLSTSGATRDLVFRLVRPHINDDVMPEDVATVLSEGLREDWGVKSAHQNPIINWKEITTVVPQRIMLWRSLRSCPTQVGTGQDVEVRGPMNILLSLQFRADHIHHLSKSVGWEVDDALQALLSVKEVRYSWSEHLT